MKREIKITIVLIVAAIIFTLAGSTLAYYIWRGNITSINFTVSRTFECSGDVGGPITSNKLAPASCTNSTYAIQREVTINPVINSPGVSVYMDMWLDVEQIDEGLANSENFKYAVTLNPNSCTSNVITSGTFKGKDRVELLSNQPFTYRTDLTQRPDLSITGYLYVWLDAAEEDPATQGNNFTLTLGGQCTQGPYVTGGAAMLIEKANGSSVTTYTEGNTKEMYAFEQPETAQLGATTDYRYIGSNPNNYIEFNNETWRIIGVFDGKIKIIKEEAFTSRWDEKTSGMGSAEGSDGGSNDWIDSQLMYMLNPQDIATNVALKPGYTYNGTYVRDSNNNIIYQKGCKPTETDGSSYSCESSPWSLNATALSQVADATYYLGGISISNDILSDYDAAMQFGQSFTTEMSYIYERGTEKYNDSRSLNWTGKVGLMYFTDYFNTYAYGVDNTCYNTPVFCGIIGGTPVSSWLYKTNYESYTISPLFTYNNPDNSNFVFFITEDGQGGYISSWWSEDVRPVVYLRPDIQLSGNGTNDGNIYRIVN